MNLILLTEEDLTGPDLAILRGPRAAHLRQTLRAEVGDEVRVGVLGGRLGRGRIVATAGEEVALELRIDRDPPPKLPLTLVLALPRPKRMRRILRTVAELGVPDLVVLHCYRVEKSYWQSPYLGEASVRRSLLEGLEQARDTVLPRVTLHRRFKPFVEDELPGIARGTRALVAHPGADAPCPLALEEPATLAIGPEGGFLPYELGKLEEAGLSPVHLGPRTLTVETALIAAIARIYR